MFRKVLTADTGASQGDQKEQHLVVHKVNLRVSCQAVAHRELAESDCLDPAALVLVEREEVWCGSALPIPAGSQGFGRCLCATSGLAPAGWEDGISPLGLVLIPFSKALFLHNLRIWLLLGSSHQFFPA